MSEAVGCHSPSSTLVTSVTFCCLITEVICERFSAGGAAAGADDAVPALVSTLAGLSPVLLSAPAGFVSPDLLSAAVGLVSPAFVSGLAPPLESPALVAGASGAFVSALSCARCGAVFGSVFSCAWVGAGRGVVLSAR